MLHSQPLRERTVAVLGASGSGKTSLIRRFALGIFSRLHVPTGGVETFERVLVLNRRSKRVVASFPRITPLIQRCMTDADAPPASGGTEVRRVRRRRNAPRSSHSKDCSLQQGSSKAGGLRISVRCRVAGHCVHHCCGVCGRVYAWTDMNTHQSSQAHPSTPPSQTQAHLPVTQPLDEETSSPSQVTSSSPTQTDDSTTTTPTSPHTPIAQASVSGEISGGSLEGVGSVMSLLSRSLHHQRVPELQPVVSSRVPAATNTSSSDSPHGHGMDNNSRDLSVSTPQNDVGSSDVNVQQNDHRSQHSASSGPYSPSNGEYAGLADNNSNTQNYDTNNHDGSNDNKHNGDTPGELPKPHVACSVVMMCVSCQLQRGLAVRDGAPAPADMKLPHRVVCGEVEVSDIPCQCGCTFQRCEHRQGDGSDTESDSAAPLLNGDITCHCEQPLLELPKRNVCARVWQRMQKCCCGDDEDSEGTFDERTHLLRRGSRPYRYSLSSPAPAACTPSNIHLLGHQRSVAYSIRSPSPSAYISAAVPSGMQPAFMTKEFWDNPNLVPFRLRVQDTPGLSSVNDILPSEFGMGVHAYVLVYSVEDLQSFYIVQAIYKQLASLIHGLPSPGWLQEHSDTTTTTTTTTAKTKRRDTGRLISSIASTGIPAPYRAEVPVRISANLLRTGKQRRRYKRRRRDKFRQVARERNDQYDDDPFGLSSPPPPPPPPLHSCQCGNVHYTNLHDERQIDTLRENVSPNGCEKCCMPDIGDSRAYLSSQPPPPPPPPPSSSDHIPSYGAVETKGTSDSAESRGIMLGDISYMVPAKERRDHGNMLGLFGMAVNAATSRLSLPVVLVGLKADVPSSKRAVRWSQGKKLAEEWGNVPFVEVCAKVPTDATAELAMGGIDEANDGKSRSHTQSSNSSYLNGNNNSHPESKSPGELLMSRNSSTGSESLPYRSRMSPVVPPQLKGLFSADEVFKQLALAMDAASGGQIYLFKKQGWLSWFFESFLYYITCGCCGRCSEKQNNVEKAQDYATEKHCMRCEKIVVSSDSEKSDDDEDSISSDKPSDEEEWGECGPGYSDNWAVLWLKFVWWLLLTSLCMSCCGPFSQRIIRRRGPHGRGFTRTRSPNVQTRSDTTTTADPLVSTHAQPPPTQTFVGGDSSNDTVTNAQWLEDDYMIGNSRSVIGDWQHVDEYYSDDSAIGSGSPLSARHSLQGVSHTSSASSPLWNNNSHVSVAMPHSHGPNAHSHVSSLTSPETLLATSHPQNDAYLYTLDSNYNNGFYSYGMSDADGF